MLTPTKLIYLPGAGGSPGFWQPVADRLAHLGSASLIGWPGFGDVPPDPGVNGIEDLVDMVCSELDQPSALIAQSMGGVVAVRAALRSPDRITHLVLVATSGGVDMSGTGAEDWRVSFLESKPSYPRWFADYRGDLSAELAKIRAPALLLWGGADAISPVAVGKRLASLLPNAAMHVVPGGDHALARERAPEVASLIAGHITGSP